MPTGAAAKSPRNKNVAESPPPADDGKGRRADQKSGVFNGGDNEAAHTARTQSPADDRGHKERDKPVSIEGDSILAGRSVEQRQKYQSATDEHGRHESRDEGPDHPCSSRWLGRLARYIPLHRSTLPEAIQGPASSSTLCPQ